MTDHAQNETKTVDVLEVHCRKWCKGKIPDWDNKTREEQDDMTYFARGFCFSHKCDNLAKAIKTAMKLYWLKGRCLQSKQKKELYFSSAVTWCWCAHKCIGMASSAATDLNLNADFKLWLRGKGRKDDLTMLGSLGLLVGDRFWAVLKNGAFLFGLRHSIIEFLQARRYVTSAQNKKENNLSATISGLSCITLKAEQKDMNQKVMLAELRAMSALHFAVMGPCLLVSATMKHFSQQRGAVRKMQDFFTKLQQDRQFARELITEQDNGIPLTFLSANEMAAIAPDGMSEGHRLAYKSMCKDAGNDDIVLDIIQYTAAHI